MKKPFKQCLMVVLLLCPFLLNAQVVSPETDTFKYYAVKKEKLNLLESPVSNGAKILEIQKSDTLEFLGTAKDKNWAKVKVENKIGYIPRRYVVEKISTPALRKSQGRVDLLDKYLHWKTKSFWKVFGGLFLLSAVLSFINYRLDKYLYSRTGGRVDFKSLIYSYAGIGIITGVFYKIWAVEVVQYFSTIKISPSWGNKLEFFLWLTLVYGLFVSMMHLFRDLKSRGLKLGALHWISYVLNGVAWGLCAFCGVVGLLLPALICFGILAYINAILDPGDSAGKPESDRELAAKEHDEETKEKARQKKQKAEDDFYRERNA